MSDDINMLDFRLNEFINSLKAEQPRLKTEQERIASLSEKELQAEREDPKKKVANLPITFSSFTVKEQLPPSKATDATGQPIPQPEPREIHHLQIDIKLNSALKPKTYEQQDKFMTAFNELLKSYYDKAFEPGLLQGIHFAQSSNSSGLDTIQLRFLSQAQRAEPGVLILDKDVHKTFADSLMNVGKLVELADSKGVKPKEIKAGIALAQKYVDSFLERQKRRGDVFDVDADKDIEREINFRKKPSESPTLQRFSKLVKLTVLSIVVVVAGVARVSHYLHKKNVEKKADAQRAAYYEKLDKKGLATGSEEYVAPKGKDSASVATPDSAKTTIPAVKEEEKTTAPATTPEVKAEDNKKVETQKSDEKKDSPPAPDKSFKSKFSSDKSVISSNSMINVSDDGKQVSDGHTLKNVSEIPTAKPERIESQDDFFKKLAQTLGQKDTPRLRDDFKEALGQADNEKRTVVVNLSKKVTVNPVMQAVIKMMGGDITKGNIPSKAADYLKKAFDCNRANLEASAGEKGDKLWTDYLAEKAAKSNDKNTGVISVG